MEKDWRYKFEHVGDRVADCIDSVIDLTSGSISGVVIGYHIHKIDKKTRKVATRVGTRVIEMRQDDPDLLSDDAKMMEIFTDLDQLQESRDNYVKEKEEIKERRKNQAKRYGVVYEPETAKA
ncbi:MAG: hypothetical protein V3V90_00335 [Thermodesulfobacteriota bacterium]